MVDYFLVIIETTLFTTLSPTLCQIYLSENDTAIHKQHVIVNVIEYLKHSRHPWRMYGSGPCHPLHDPVPEFENSGG